MRDTSNRAGLVVWFVLAATALQTGASYAADPPLFGREPTAAEIAAWNIDVTPSGAGLRVGKGSVARGQAVYTEQCSACHGATGIEGPRNRLVGGVGTLATPNPIKTVGSYWPYATTVFDYINRAMPFTSPGSLPPDDVYSVVAWLLYKNGILPSGATLDQNSLPRVKMPNRDGFVPVPVFEPGRQVEKKSDR